MTVTAAFDPAKHPHHHAGDSRGGQWEAKVGVTPFRPEDTAAGFYDTAKFKEFDSALAPMAKARGVTIDAKERTQGFWLGDQEPSVALDVHDGEDGVRLFAEDVRSRWDQDGVLLFHPDEDGPDVAYSVPASGANVPAALSKAGIDGATIHGDRVVIYGTEDDQKKVAALADSLGIDIGKVEFGAGHLAFVERNG